MINDVPPPLHPASTMAPGRWAVSKIAWIMLSFRGLHKKLERLAKCSNFDVMSIKGEPRRYLAYGVQSGSDNLLILAKYDLLLPLSY